MQVSEELSTKMSHWMPHPSVMHHRWQYTSQRSWVAPSKAKYPGATHLGNAWENLKGLGGAKLGKQNTQSLSVEYPMDKNLLEETYPETVYNLSGATVSWAMAEAPTVFFLSTQRNSGVWPKLLHHRTLSQHRKQLRLNQLVQRKLRKWTKCNFKHPAYREQAQKKLTWEILETA